jgi:hypothetical protein
VIMGGVMASAGPFSAYRISDRLVAEVYYLARFPMHPVRHIPGYRGETGVAVVR